MPQTPDKAKKILEKALDMEIISAQQLREISAAKLSHIRLLDVRTPQEQAQGVIPGSDLFPCDHNLENPENTAIFNNDFHHRFAPELFSDQFLYILICRTGPRTAIALDTFLKHHIPACELLGGTTEWQRLGFQLEKMPIQAVDNAKAA